VPFLPDEPYVRDLLRERERLSVYVDHVRAAVLACGLAGSETGTFPAWAGRACEIADRDEDSCVRVIRILQSSEDLLLAFVAVADRDPHPYEASRAFLSSIGAVP
jgi:hypothetical protein